MKTEILEGEPTWRPQLWIAGGILFVIATITTLIVAGFGDVLIWIVIVLALAAGTTIIVGVIWFIACNIMEWYYERNNVYVRFEDIFMFRPLPCIKKKPEEEKKQ